MKNRKKGFTLIELVVVLVVISVLIAATIPAINKFKEAANKRADELNKNAILEAATLYLSDNDWKTDSGILTTKKLFEEKYLDIKSKAEDFVSPVSGKAYTITVDTKNKTIEVKNGE